MTLEEFVKSLNQNGLDNVEVYSEELHKELKIFWVGDRAFKSILPEDNVKEFINVLPHLLYSKILIKRYHQVMFADENYKLNDPIPYIIFYGYVDE